MGGCVYFIYMEVPGYGLALVQLDEFFPVILVGKGNLAFCLKLVNYELARGEVHILICLKINRLTNASNVVDMGYYKRSSWVIYEHREIQAYTMGLCKSS